MDLIKAYSESLHPFPTESQLSIAITKNGQTHYIGLIKNEKGVAIIDNANSAFEIGSITKVFTGHILAQQVVENKVGINDPIQPFLPFLLLDNPPITLRHLAQHTSGIQRLPHDFFEQPGYLADNPYANTTEEQFAEYFSVDLRLDSIPGEKFQYTNLGMSLLSYIISRIEDRPFPSIVAERIFTPLGMNSSGYDRKTLSVPIVEGIDKEGRQCPHWDAGIYAGSLGVLSTAIDMTKYAKAQMDPSSVACQYQANQTFPVEANISSLLGWMENLFLPENIRIRNLNGGTGGFGASLMVDPDANTALVVLSNIYPYHYLEKIVPLNKRLLLTSPPPLASALSHP